MAAIHDVSYILCQVPDLVGYGSKPLRELSDHPELKESLQQHLQSFDEVSRYRPHHVFVGAESSWTLAQCERPWYNQRTAAPIIEGSRGRIVDESLFYAVLKAADPLGLVRLDPQFVSTVLPRVQKNPLTRAITEDLALERGWNSHEASLPLLYEGEVVGHIRGDHPQDDSLAPSVMLENLSSKASAYLALQELFYRRPDLSPMMVDYLLGTGEEAIGDRYQRGGGNLAKAVGEMAGCQHATGSDVKAFCSAPVHALAIAGALVDAKLFRHVVLVAGGSLAKLGMKFLSHLRHDMPILEDVLAGFAIWVGPDEKNTAHIRLDAVGRHPVGAGAQPQAIYESLVVEPLNRIGLRILDVDRYAVEMHNPDITAPAGGGDVPLTNYRTLGALAVRRGEATRDDLSMIVQRFGSPGFSPTQGHIAAGIPLLGEMLDGIRSRELRRAMLVAKGSLFLGRMTTLSDGVSVLLENPQG